MQRLALKTAFHVVTQDKKQQCYKYNELKVSIYLREILHVIYDVHIYMMYICI